MPKQTTQTSGSVSTAADSPDSDIQTAARDCAGLDTIVRLNLFHDLRDDLRNEIALHKEQEPDVITQIIQPDTGRQWRAALQSLQGQLDNCEKEIRAMRESVLQKKTPAQTPAPRTQRPKLGVQTDAEDSLL